MDDSGGRGGGRVRKKSAKVIEMEEAEEFERKLFNKKPKTKPRSPLPSPPLPAPIRKVPEPPTKSPVKRKTESTVTNTVKTTPKSTKKEVADDSGVTISELTPSKSPENSSKPRKPVPSPPALSPVQPLLVSQAQFTSTQVAGGGGLKLKFGLEPKKEPEPIVDEASDDDMSVNIKPSSPPAPTPAKKKTKKRKKELVESSDQDEMEVTQVKVRKKKKVKVETAVVEKPKVSSDEGSDSRSASALLAALAAAPAPTTPVIPKLEPDPPTISPKVTQTLTKVKIKKRSKPVTTLEIGNSAGILGPVMKPEEGSSDDDEEDQYTMQFHRTMPTPPADNQVFEKPPAAAVKKSKSVSNGEQNEVITECEVPVSAVEEIVQPAEDQEMELPPPIQDLQEDVVKKIKIRKDKPKKKRGRKPKGEERKEKRKRRPTAYTMWCNSYRPKVLKANPGIDFAAISRRLGEIWQAMPNKEKMCWRRKAKKMITKGSQLITTGKKSTLLSSKGLTAAVAGGTAEDSSKLVVPSSSSTAAAEAVASAALTTTSPSGSKLAISSASKEDHKLDKSAKVSCNPIDVAAHLKLLGESLSIIGARLQEHRGQIAVQGSLSVLLDSLLCSLAPLTCLCNQIPEFTDPQLLATQADTLNNIAYVMPGIG